ncbi:MAG: DUF1302 family protein [Deltaproteobacteria bacterium]
MIKVLKVFLILLSCPSLAAILESQINTQSRIGYHLVAPTDLSSHRHELELNTTVRFRNPWSLGAGFRALVEGAYASNSSRYLEPVRSRDTQDFILRDLYLQYKSGPFTLKMGNQQVVWGEAFGFYFADLINPKDFRDFGIGPLERNRLHTPIINFKWNIDDTVLQGLYVVKPYFNKTPNIGSDFSFPFNKFFAPNTFTFNDERTLTLASKNAEFGGRLSPNIPGADLSFLYFNYFDRAPVYVSNQNNGLNEIAGKHYRIETLGTTLSLPVSTCVLRSELLYHLGKQFTFFDGALNSFKSNQFVGVLGLDYIVGDRWRVGIQVSENYRTRTVPGALELSSTQLITSHGSFTLTQDHIFDLLIAYAPHDGSSLTEISYTIPLSKRVDLLFAADLFNGGNSSQFGLFHPASRGYIQIKTFLGNEAKL